MAMPVVMEHQRMASEFIHVRCKECQRHIAGPLSENTDQRTGEVGYGDFMVRFDEFIVMRDITFSTKGIYDFEFESGDDLYVHPQWLDGWHGSWSDTYTGCATRRMFASADGYGCCGPRGRVVCVCGGQLGRGAADCDLRQWLVLFSSAIDRSDTTDGIWVVHADATSAPNWIEECGEISNNLRNGEWEYWDVLLTHDMEAGRNKNRESIWTRKEKLERRLIRVEEWNGGQLIASTAE